MVPGYGEGLGERYLGWGVLIATFPFAGEYGLRHGQEMELEVLPCAGHVGSDLICGGRKMSHSGGSELVLASMERICERRSIAEFSRRPWVVGY